jgi:hypothetical protein
MEVRGKATRITLTDLSTPQMRAFHLTWFTFFLCFFGWFGIAPLMAVVREDLMLTKVQIGNTVIASVAITVLIRLLIGPLCDRYGARLTYSGLLLLTSLPVMGIGLASPQLYGLSPLSSGNWSDRCVLRHHAISYLHHVCPQLCGHGKRHDSRMGQFGWRGHPDRHALDLRSLCQPGGASVHWLAASDGGAGDRAVCDRICLLLPDSGRPGGQI